MKEKELFKKSDTSGFTNNSDLNQKILRPWTKAELKSEEDKIVIVINQAFYLSYFRDKSHL